MACDYWLYAHRKIMEYITLDSCRACLSQNEDMHALFEIYENGLSLATILQNFLGVELYSYDYLPKKICQECATVLVKFYNFSVIFEESSQKLQRLLLCSGELNQFYCKYVLDKDAYVPDNCPQLKYNSDNDCCEFDNSECKEVLVENQTNDCSTSELIKFEVDTDSRNSNPEVVKSEYIEDIKEELQEDESSQNVELYPSTDNLKSRLESSHAVTVCDYGDNKNSNYKSSVNPDKGDQSTKNICKLCRRAFTNAFLFKRHIKLHIQGKKFICEICGYISYKKSYLADHMETHTTNKPYKCSYCGKNFRRRSAFSRHKRLHTNPKEIICEVCGRTFNDKGTLKTHILLLHIKSRNFVCIICNQSFPLKSTLDKHLRRHQQKESARKNFSCSECNMQYFDKSSLKRHYITKHSCNNVKQKCQYCNKEYTSKTSLFKHIRKYHKENLI